MFGRKKEFDFIVDVLAKRLTEEEFKAYFLERHDWDVQKKEEQDKDSKSFSFFVNELQSQYLKRIRNLEQKVQELQTRVA